MKKLKIEIQVILLTVSIAVAVIISGYLAYQSLSQIVDTIHKEARPDLKLLLIKDIASDLNEVENTIRLYSLTGDNSFLHPYRQLDASVQEKLNTLIDYAAHGPEDSLHINSINLLANRKLLIWDEIRALHQAKKDAHNTFSSLYSKIDTAIIQPDTIRFKQEKKKSFFKRLLSKKDTSIQQPIIIDKSKEKEIIKQEIAGIEKQITGQTRRLQVREKSLLELNIQITQKLNQHISNLENSEQERLETKTQEADFMAAQTYRRMAIFTVAAVVFLIIILILFFQNLRRNKIYQQVLKKAKAEAESLARAKEMFVATVSHEMRTPVNAIYGLTEQMLRKANPDEMEANLKVVHQSAGHLIALVNDTLDFSKIESQKLKIEQIDFLPDEIISEVHTLHKDSALKKGVELIVSNHIEKSTVLRGDPVRLKQILINLITNAIKFTDYGYISLAVSCRETSEQSYMVHFEVSDTGIGISKENQHKIFEEFVQLDTSLSQKKRGAGLGLSIVKKLVILQNGTIDVESDLGKGTRFIVQIPYMKGNPSLIKTQQAEQVKIPSWFKNLHFLIVDDEEFNVYLIRNILKTWGVTFTEAGNGLEALELVKKNSFDMILMDIRMPVMDGYEAAQLILQHRPSSKIIALTATTRPADVQKIESAGMQAYLLKPFAEADLVSTILKLLPEKVESPMSGAIEEDTAINLDELKRISGGDPAFFNEMLRIFIRSSEEALKKFREHTQDPDLIALADTAHKLAAPVKHLKAARLYNHLKKLETSTGNINPEELHILVSAIEKEIISINSILKQKLSE